MHFDVFLSHNSQDKPEVERIAEKLKREGIEPWLDKWCLMPGGDWQTELAQGLRDSQACAVFVGPHGIGDWERLEFNLATNRMAAERTFRVFLVLLPGLPEPFDTSTLPPFLSTRTWVDLRKGLLDPRGLQLLLNAVKGLAPGPETPIEPRTGVAPYRGLQAFDEDHVEFFFGREADTQRLIEKLKRTRFLAVLGPSGSGKSSLVRAGLLPALRKGVLPESAPWSIRVFTPGAQPLTALAANYVRLYPQASMAKVLDELAADKRALHLSVSLALADRALTERVVLVVDQSEEVFTLCKDETERVRFLENLVYAACIPDGRSVVVLTMRADFYSKCATYPELATLIAAEQYLVSPMDVVSLRRVIEEPAWRVGLELEPGLAETILDDVESQPGALPLLEHALLELWQRRRGRLLTLEGYRESGSVEGAIAKRADSIYTIFTPEQQKIARRILLRLTQPGEATEDTRRRASVSELVTCVEELEQVRSVVQTMADARLLITDGGVEPDGQTVEVAHETLIRGWPRLRSWINEDRAGLLIHHRLSEAALDWRQREEDESVVYRGTRLAEAEEWRVRYGTELNELERRFLDASNAVRDQELRERQQLQERELAQARALADEQRRLAELERQRAEEQAQSTRRLRIRYLAATVFALAALVAVAGFVTAYLQANRERVRADNRRIAVETLAKLDEAPDLALLLGVQAFRRGRNVETQSHLLRILQHEPGLERFLHSRHGGLDALTYHPSGTRLAGAGADGALTIWDALSGQPIGEALFTNLKGVDAVAFGPVEGRVAVAGRDGTLQMWDLAARTMLASAPPLDPQVTSAAFSANGRRAAVGSRFDISLWDLEAWRPLGRVGPAGDVFIVSGLAFSPDGRRVASADVRRPIQLWDVTTARALGPPLRAGEEALQVAFAPDGRRLAEAAVWIHVWDLDRRKPIGLPLRGHESNVERLVFSPDGDRLASLGGDALRLWDLGTSEPRGRVLRTWSAYSSLTLMQDVVFSPDGTRLAASDSAGKVIVWRVDPKARLAQPLDTSGYAVAYSSDGTRLAYGERNGVLRFWDPKKGEALGPPVHVPQSEIFNLKFSPDGRQLAIVGIRNIMLWDIEAGRATSQMRHSDRPLHVPAVVYSPDGNVLATGAMDGMIRLWNTANGDLIRTLDAHEKTVVALTFSPDGSLLVSGGGEGAIRVWRTGTGEPDGPPLMTQGPPLNNLQFLPGGREMLSVSDSAIILWDARTRKPLGDPLPLGNDKVAGGAVAFDSRGMRVALLLQDSSVRLWDIAARAPLPETLRLVQFVGAPSFPSYGGIAFSPDGLQLATATLGPRVLVWDVDPSSWERQACRIANRDLTREEWNEYLGPNVAYARTCIESSFR